MNRLPQGSRPQTEYPFPLLGLAQAGIARREDDKLSSVQIQAADFLGRDDPVVVCRNAFPSRPGVKSVSRTPDALLARPSGGVAKSDSGRRKPWVAK